LTEIRSRPAAQVYLCGPFADPDKPAKGGYQIANMRTITGLRQRGIDVHELAYAQPDSPGLRKVLEYAVNFVVLMAKIARCERNSIVHIAAPRRTAFLVEQYVLVRLAKLRGCLTIYDVRAGLASDQSRIETSAVYRRYYPRLLRSVDLVMAESEAHIPFIEAVAGRTAVLMPNQVDLSAVPSRVRSDAAAPVPVPVIAYAGSIKPEKGVETILEAAELLVRRGFDVAVRIAGSGDQAYIDELRTRFSHVPVEWLGSQTNLQVLQLFSSSHFFVFPTRWVGEGQSNALTEAMSCGSVPIVSDHGFNAATAGDCGVVLAPEASAEDYACAIESVWTSGRWEELSCRAARRVQENFSSVAIIDRLVEHYVLLEQQQPRRSLG
jgi:glycosyltransferase involved in cell wall biosynthesis